MAKTAPFIFFDKNDYELLQIVDDVLERGPSSRAFRSSMLEFMHPHGIKEMAAPSGLRIAYAVVSLLGSLEKGRAQDRLRALRALRDEVLFSTQSYYLRNTARVLMQIMKELVRTRADNEIHRLKLAHDFRAVLAGNPRKVRKELAKYNLVEMPEEWNQLAFDDHVHDANTKGRKSPTHLIMDAWIKGIRKLTVVYYNYVQPDVIKELLEAGRILNINVRVGIEISVKFRDKYVRFTWEPNGFTDNRAFLEFLKSAAVAEFMAKGFEVSQYQQKYVFDVLAVFNRKHREPLNRELGVSLAPLEHEDFLAFVRKGQPSLLHLARFIHNGLSEQVEFLSRQDAGGKSSDATTVDAGKINHLTVDKIIADYLLPSKNRELHNPMVPQAGSELPELLDYELHEILARLLSLHGSSNFVLSLSNLSAQDALELLYAGEGMFTHIEVYNLKDSSYGLVTDTKGGDCSMQGEAVRLKNPDAHYSLISKLQEALNDDNAIGLKSAIRDIIHDHDEQQLLIRNRIRILPEGNRESVMLSAELSELQSRKLELIDILSDLDAFHNSYRKRELKSRLGSSSTGLAEHIHGMGFVVIDTLPSRARRVFLEEGVGDSRKLIPVSATITKIGHVRVKPSPPLNEESFISRTAGPRKWVSWTLERFNLHGGVPGNIGTLGGLSKQIGQGITVVGKEKRVGNPWKYLNTNVKNSLKVLIGFIPAFLTFFLTKEWWVLAYLGAFIWFGITGSRNIIQSVLGGGGIRRSPLLPWNSLVSWSRIADSLLYTGFSVPLLDFLVKTLLLDRAMGVTTTTNPVLLYAIMGLVNGIYISSHNLVRGLPKGATFGNFFRSILAIPVAILLNTLIGSFLGLAGVVDVNGMLQKWAAIISKFASDCVAAVIEGLADRQTNIKARLREYNTKIVQVFSIFSRFELLFPEEDMLAALQAPKVMMKSVGHDAEHLMHLSIVNALDLMYFWMYQPRARKALVSILEGMSEEELLIFFRSQLIITRQKEISRFLVDGLVGKHFSKALSFYLDQSPQYMRDMEKLNERFVAVSSKV